MAFRKMRPYIPVSLSIFLLLILPGASSLASPGTLVISEIMFNPDGDENAREFVEIVNLSDAPVSLEGCRIGDGAAFDTLIPVRNDLRVIPGQGYALILDPDYFAAGEPYSGIPEATPLYTISDKAIGSRGLSNSNPEPVYLLSAAGDTLSLVRYPADCPPGHSWERIIPWGGDSPENFRPSRSPEGTPGLPNSVTPPGRNPVTPWGVPTLGHKTRSKKKPSSKYIVRRAGKGR